MDARDIKASCRTAKPPQEWTLTHALATDAAQASISYSYGLTLEEPRQIPGQHGPFGAAGNYFLIFFTQ